MKVQINDTEYKVWQLKTVRPPQYIRWGNTVEVQATLTDTEGKLHHTKLEISLEETATGDYKGYSRTYFMWQEQAWCIVDYKLWSEIKYLEGDAEVDRPIFRMTMTQKHVERVIKVDSAQKHRHLYQYPEVLQRDSVLAKTDNNYCTVVATATVLDVEYEEAYRLLQAKGRQHGQGMRIGDMLRGDQIGHHKFEQVYKKKFYRGVDRKGESNLTIRTAAEQFPKGRYLVFTKSHALSIVNGKVVDNLRFHPKAIVTSMYRLVEEVN